MATATKSYVKHQRPGTAKPTTQPAAKSYIKFPSPLAAREVSSWRVADLCAAYQLPKQTCPGGGVIGILELGGGWKQADLDMFSKTNGLPAITVADRPLGGANQPGGEADAEVLLDIEVAAAVYHYATGQMPEIKVFWVPNTFQSFREAVQAAVAEGCDVLSISWGADEKRWTSMGSGEAKLLEAAVAEAAQAGLVVFTAAGDNSSGDSDPGANVDLPSSCPHVIACGGTTKLRGLPEKVWGTASPNGEGTGGGFSAVFSMPAWQASNGAPNAPPLNPKGDRMVPDVAANADPQTGYLVVIDGVETTIGGTSAVAPFYAGLFAAFGRKLGAIGPTLWQNEAAFTDIVSGTNGGFVATTGPDACTGLGVPDGSALAAVFSDRGAEGDSPVDLLSRALGSNLPAHSIAVQAAGRTGAAAKPSVSGASYTSFALWHGSGLVRLQINDPSITADSRVFVSLSEYSTDARLNRFVGSAQMSVLNVAPTNGAVVVLANVSWPNALNVRFDYFVDPQQI